MAIRKTLVVIAALTWGCTPQAYIHDLKTDHPAHPDAQAGMLPRPSTGPAVGDPTSPGGEDETEHDVGSKGRMNHGDHRAGGDKFGSGRGEGQAGEALYQCPMHPEVTSRDPERRCPKCNMKINKPIKGGGSTPGHEGHGGHSQ